MPNTDCIWCERDEFGIYRCTEPNHLPIIDINYACHYRCHYDELDDKYMNSLKREVHNAK